MVSAHFSSLNMLFVCIGLLLVVAPYVLCTASFSMKLMHRDSPRSALYDPTSTPSSRLDASIKRSASRADYVHSVNSRSPNSPLNLPEPENPFANLSSYGGEFLISAHVGTQVEPKHVTFVMDIGGSLIWISCFPCRGCYDTKLPRFNPRYSTSYDELSCESDDCKKPGYVFKCGDHDNCEYKHSYVGNSWVSGILSTDSIILPGMQGSEIHLRSMIFGCTYKTHGHFSQEVLGFLGLGGGEHSFVRQLGLRGYPMMFSYCIPDSIEKSSAVFFGSSAIVIGHNTQIARMIVTNLYHVIVDSITVGGEAHVVGDYFVMDAGTFLTYVGKFVLDNIIRMVKENTHGLTMIQVTPESTFKLCYSVTNANDVNKLPPIKLNLAEDATFVLKRKNAYLKFPDKKAMCLAIVEKNSEGYSIIGGHAQVNHRIGFDLEKNKLSFRHVECK